MKTIHYEIGHNPETSKTTSPSKNNKSSIQFDNNQNNEKKTIFRSLAIIVITSSIVLVVTSFCLFWFLRKKPSIEDNSTDNNKDIITGNSTDNSTYNSINNSTYSSTNNSKDNGKDNSKDNSAGNSAGNSADIETENLVNSEENEHIIISIEELNFDEIKSLLESKAIEKNINSLNKTKDKINNLLDFCENPNLEKKQINPNISLILPDFLQNVTKPALKIAKSDIELYKRKYEELAININNFAGGLSRSLKNLSFPLNELKAETNELFSKFEETLKNLCIPLILVEKLLNNNTRSLSIDNEI